MELYSRTHPKMGHFGSSQNAPYYIRAQSSTQAENIAPPTLTHSWTGGMSRKFQLTPSAVVGDFNGQSSFDEQHAG